LAGGLPFEAKAVSNTFKDFAGAMPETDDPKVLRNSRTYLSTVVIEFLGALDVIAGVAATTFDLSARLTHAVVATNNQTTLGRSSKRKIRAWECTESY
jgi:hypothetical protein